MALPSLRNMINGYGRGGKLPDQTASDPPSTFGPKLQPPHQSVQLQEQLKASDPLSRDPSGLKEQPLEGSGQLSRDSSGRTPSHPPAVPPPVLRRAQSLHQSTTDPAVDPPHSPTTPLQSSATFNGQAQGLQKPPATTMVLKTQLRCFCEGCISKKKRTVRKIQEFILKLEGVEQVRFDCKKELMEVHYTMDTEWLLTNLKEKFKSNVEVVQVHPRAEGNGKKVVKKDLEPSGLEGHVGKISDKEGSRSKKKGINKEEGKNEEKNNEKKHKETIAEEGDFGKIKHKEGGSSKKKSMKKGINKEEGKYEGKRDERKDVKFSCQEDHVGKITDKENCASKSKDIKRKASIKEEGRNVEKGNKARLGEPTGLQGYIGKTKDDGGIDQEKGRKVGLGESTTRQGHIAKFRVNGSNLGINKEKDNQQQEGKSEQEGRKAGLGEPTRWQGYIGETNANCGNKDIPKEKDNHKEQGKNDEEGRKAGLGEPTRLEGHIGKIKGREGGGSQEKDIKWSFNQEKDNQKGKVINGSLGGVTWSEAKNGYIYDPSLYGIELTHPPQLFSDENPHACSIM